MQTHEVGHGDYSTWNFPKGVKVPNDDTLYIVDYDYRDASDPMDMSETFRVNFIEKVPDEIVDAIKQKHKLEDKIYGYIKDCESRYAERR